MMDIDNEIKKQGRGYSLIFLIENILRVSMHNIMIKKVGVDYFKKEIFPEYEYKEINPNIKINIINNASELKKHERTSNVFLNHDFPHFWYLDFRILISVIDYFGSNYFREMFTNDRFMNDIIIRLKNIEPIRNAIAHNRYISSVNLADLESLFKLLEIGLNDIYRKNFADISLNPLEKIILNFQENLENIINIIRRGEILNREILRTLNSNFSVLYSIKIDDDKLRKYNEIVNLLEAYNNLPRKPGRGDDISNFIRTSGIKELISLFAESFGGNYGT